MENPGNMKTYKKLKEELIKVNGRTRYYTHLSSLKSHGDGKYSVNRYSKTYRIEGGKKAGGRRTDWWIDHEDFKKGGLKVKSLKNALDELDNM